MSIDEQAIITAVLGHVATLGYGTSANEKAPGDYVQEPRPFAFVTELATIREALDDAQSNDSTTFKLHLWRDALERTEMIADIQALIALLQGDTTLAGACDLCQLLDSVQVGGESVDGIKTYWVVDIVAEFES